MRTVDSGRVLGGLLFAAAIAIAAPTVTAVHLISQARVDRWTIEATYTADVTSASGAFRSVTATVTSASPATTILDGDLRFPDVSSGGTVTSLDTFTIRHDLHTAFQNSFLQFQVHGTPVLNRAPVANAGPDQTVPLGATVTLNGSASSDADGDPLTYHWTLTSKPSGSVAGLANANSATATFVADRPGGYTASLIVNDGRADSAPDSVIVSTINSPPVADPGPDRTVTTGTTVTLDGSQSSDIDGDPLQFAWNFVSKPAGSAAALSNPAAVMPSFTVDVFGTYVVRLIVNDGHVNSTPRSVTITTANSAPVADAGPDQTALVMQTVHLDGSRSADVDRQALTFHWSIIGAPTGSAAILSNPSAVMPSFTIDRAGSYIVQLIVNDGLVNSAPDTVTITTTNSPPVANAGPDQAVHAGDTVTLNGSSSSDPDGDHLTFSWSLTTRPAGSSATLNNRTAVMPTFVADLPGQYVAQLIVNDGSATSAPDTVVVSTNNTRPVANAGPDQTVAVNSRVTLNGSGSSDVEGDTLSFAWSFVSRPAGSAAELSHPTAVTPMFVPDVPGDYVVSLVVNDGFIDSLADTVKITTTNSRPIANAGADQVVDVGSTVSLNGTASHDQEGLPLTYRWSLTGRPAGSAAALVNPNTATPTFTADKSGTYVAQLIVNDGFIDSLPDTVVVDTRNVPPVADAGPDQIVNIGALAVLNGGGSHDADGQPLTYSWTFTSRPAGSAAALTNPTSVSPSFTADIAGMYVVQLIVNDGSANSAPDTVVVTTRNRPPVANAGADVSIRLGETAHLNGSGSSDPDGDAITYRWSIVSAPSGSTAALTGAATSQPALTPDVAGAYTIRLIVNDGQLDSAADTVTVSVTSASGGLINGLLQSGSIDVAGQVDTWTFDANAGDRIAVHIGEIIDHNDFRPWIRVIAPNGATLSSASGLAAAQSGDVVAPSTGTYKVLVASFDSGFDGTGTYRLTMTHTPGPITVAPGDEGGPLTNGGIHTGTLLRGDLDVWTFTATAGERIAVHIGEITDNDDFRPWIRLWAPNGASLGSASGLTAAAIGDAIAPVTGTYLVLVASFNSGFDGSGTYRLNMVKSSGAITVSTGDQGGAISNGGEYTGEILQGDIDVWTFQATAGDRMAVHIGEITDNNDFRPWIRIWAPNGASLGSASGLDAAAIGDVIAPVTGTYLVVVSSFNAGFDGSGTYRLNMAKTPAPVVVDPGDQGGALTNGGILTGDILRGEIDVWTFTATVGDRIAVHIGELTDRNDFRPWIRVWAPNGASLGSASGLDAAAIGDVIAPVTGTYLVVVGSFNAGFNGSGTYQLNMIKSSGAVTISPGDDGGPITNGGLHGGTITRGDIDVWTFAATAGDRVGVHIGEIADHDDFRPWIRLWAPNGASLGSASGLDAAAIGDAIAPVTGTYVIVVGSFNSGFDGTGTYRINMVKTPAPITISSGDQGGALTDGGVHTGEILRGDVDVWTFTAAIGDRIALHIGETTDNNDFRPWIRIWAPNGASLGSASGLAAAAIGDVIAPVAGTYLVVVSSFNSGFDGTGTYRLNLAKTPGPITVSTGDQGGALTSGVAAQGAIVVGDVDIWTINAVAGQHITATASELTDNNDFRPWIRVWAPNGASLGSASGLASATIANVVAPVTGTYMVVVATFNSGFDGTGTYSVAATVSP